MGMGPIKAARPAVDAYLKENRTEKLVPLCTLSVVADRAVRKAGRKGDLYSSLYSYVRFLPKDAKLRWAPSDLLSAVNPYCSDPLPPEIPCIPGSFDAAADMGPNLWSQKLRENHDRL